jgi:hypothetical protein
VSLEEAPLHFEEQGTMPYEAVVRAIEDETHTSTLPVVSPSQVDESNTCRREVLIKKHFPYGMCPTDRWAAMEGAFFHKLWEGANVNERYHQEIYLPDQHGADDGHPKVRIVDAPWGKQIRLVEAFPGYWTRGRVDRAALDWKTIWDHKTSKYPWSPVPPWKRDPNKPPWFKASGESFEDRDARLSWPLPLNLYARMVHILKDVEVEKLWVWRAYRGSLDPKWTFRKIPIRRMSDDELWEKIGPHVESLQGWLEEAETTPERALDKAPKDGYDKKMFGAQKCSRYCGVKPLCFERAGMTTF